MRIAIGAMLFEGNTFSPVIATRADFAAKYLLAGPDVLTVLRGTGTEIGGAIDEAEAGGNILLPLLATHGGAGGRVAAATMRAFVDELLARLLDLPPVDGIYLALHGAFIAENERDVEGMLLERVRQQHPGVPLVVSCDLHAHVTDRMLTHCDALTGYRHYPHDDTYETGRRALSMLRDIVARRLRPALVRCRVPMIIPAQKQRTRGDGPMVEIRALAESHLGGSIRDIAYFCVQPWIDAPALGASIVVTANEDEASAIDIATQLGRALWERRSRFLVETLPAAQAIAHGLATPGLVVLADASDCVGGGASGDSVHMICALARHAPGASATIHIADAEAVAAARHAAPGTRLNLLLGNRRDPVYGPPLAVDAEVLRHGPDHFIYAGGLMRGVRAETGGAVVLRVGAIDVLVTGNACYEYADEAFRAAGVDVRSHKFVVVKNPVNYQQSYADAALQLIVDTPGPTTPNLASLPFRSVDRPLFPLDRDCPIALHVWTRSRAWTTSA